MGVGEHQKNNDAKNTHGEKENKRHKWRDVSSNGVEKTIKPESALILPDQAAREAQGYKHIRVYKQFLDNLPSSNGVPTGLQRAESEHKQVLS